MYPSRYAFYFLQEVQLITGSVIDIRHRLSPILKGESEIPILIHFFPPEKSNNEEDETFCLKATRADNQQFECNQNNTIDREK